MTDCKIIATTRTLNESANIDRFCQSYHWADKVIVADGGSDDDTVQRAKQYPNVIVAPFTDRVYGNNGIWRNPHGKHINHCINTAIEHGADWIIFDDVDCIPTVSLQGQLRGILETTNKRTILLYRLYVLGTDRYFPAMNDPGQSLYAWHKSAEMRAWESDPWKHRLLFDPNGEDVLRLERPLACLHYFAETDKQISRKLAFYRGSGEQPDAQHPITFGKIEFLPEWARF